MILLMLKLILLNLNMLLFQVENYLKKVMQYLEIRESLVLGPFIMNRVQPLKIQ